MSSILEVNEAVRLVDLAEIAQGKAKVYPVVKNGNGEIVLVAFDRDVVIPTHHVHCDVVVQVLEGEVMFTVKGSPDRDFRMRAGDFIRMTPDTEHSLKGLTPVKVMVTKINV